MTHYPTHAETIVIGGGIIGLSVAYHLARRGHRDVVLLERHELTSGTSWHAAGIVGPLRANINLTRLAIYATELFATLEADTGQATGYRRTGGMWLANDADRLTELKRICAMGEMTGLDVGIIGPGEARRRWPQMETGDLVGALWVGEDAHTNPVDTCIAYAKGAKSNGVRIFEHTAVTGIETSRGSVCAVKITGNARITCTNAVNCAGLWARQVGAMAGVSVPLQAVEHMYIVTEPIDGLPSPCPVLRDLDGRIYVKEDAGKLVIGGFEADAKLWSPPIDGAGEPYQMFQEDWDQFEPFMTAALHRLPVLNDTGIQHFMNGPESFTPDTRQFMGEAPEVKNFFVAAGFNSIGIMSSAGVGRVLADWIIDSEAPEDVWATDIARADPLWSNDGFLASRTQEAVANQFAMHWPLKQMKTARGLRQSPLHQHFESAGAVFGETAGWERPFWFAETEAEREFRYSYGDQHWWSAAKREARQMSEYAALLELSPFTKLMVEGKDAHALLQWLCCNTINAEPGAFTYTQMLNSRGGIEADVTVHALAKDRFKVVGGAATRWKDLMWLRRGAGRFPGVVIEDQTEDEAVIGLMGPKSAANLRCVAGNLPDLPFARSDMVEIAGVPVMRVRISFAGEFGYELYCPAANVQPVLNEIVDNGRDFGLGHAGHLCLDGCRLEKGFRHWGHDIGPDDTPLEAGLGFAVRLDKPGGFLGRDALLRQQEQGLGRHLLLFEAPEARPLLLHDEPIYLNGELTGITTSGGLGPRTGKHLTFGYINCSRGDAKSDLMTAAYEVKVAGELFPLLALDRPPYDPDGVRMRGAG